MKDWLTKYCHVTANWAFVYGEIKLLKAKLYNFFFFMNVFDLGEINTVQLYIIKCKV